MNTLVIISFNLLLLYSLAVYVIGLGNSMIVIHYCIVIMIVLFTIVIVVDLMFELTLTCTVMDFNLFAVGQVR